MRRKFLKSKTKRELLRILRDLANLGEISTENLGRYDISDSHLFMVLRSGLAICTSEGIIAAPLLLSLLPIDNFIEWLSELGLSVNSVREWANFEATINSVDVENCFEQLGYHYAFIPKQELIFEDPITRPVFFHKYIENQDDLAEWNFDRLLSIGYAYSEQKNFVHSALPIKDNDYRLSTYQLSLWHNPFYWTALQFLILSDYQTGSAYVHEIHLVLLDGFDNDGKLNIYFNNRYVCDFRALLGDIFSHFNWIWVNPTDEIMAIFKLLYKLDVMEKERNGRAVLTNEFRKELYERNSKHAYQEKLSRGPRYWMCDMIKKRLGDVS